MGDVQEPVPPPSEGLPIIFGPSDVGTTYEAVCSNEQCQLVTTFTLWHNQTPPEDLKCVQCGTTLADWVVRGYEKS